MISLLKKAETLGHDPIACLATVGPQEMLVNGLKQSHQFSGQLEFLLQHHRKGTTESHLTSALRLNNSYFLPLTDNLDSQKCPEL